MEITVNGNQIAIENNSNIIDLLDKFELKANKVAIEYNGEIIPRDKYNSQYLTQGDVLEIVTPVGGG